MQLIYIYIDRYRNFDRQEIRLSESYNVSYSAESGITIDKNEDYINVYPYNIISVNAILGKNGRGKTSLLDLIGKKISSRHECDEIWESSSNKFQQGSASKINKQKKSITFESEYFMLYYTGKQVNNEDAFVFETCNIDKYLGLFEWKNDFVDVGYYRSKGWFAGICTYKDGKLTYHGDTLHYIFSDDGKSIQNETSILLMKNETPYYFRNNYDLRVDSKIALRRVNVTTKCPLMYNKLKFLIGQMNKESKELFNNDNYVLDVKFKNAKHSLEDALSREYNGAQINDVIIPLNNFADSGLSLLECKVLSFLYDYLCYAFYNIFFLPVYGMDVQKDEKIKKISKLKIDGNCYSKIKEYYHKILEIVFSEIDSPQECYMELFVVAENALEEFLCNCDSNNVTVIWNNHGFELVINKETHIDNLKNLFEDIIDENHKKNVIDSSSVMESFISCSIRFLSDGEQENLSLFTALDDQITQNMTSVENYILLFDEIERSMHPEMCRTLMYNLFEFLKQYKDKKFQLIISSHSPFIVGDLMKEDIICLENDSGRNVIKTFRARNNTFGQNIHVILKDEFFLNRTYGEFARKRMVQLIDYLTSKIEGADLLEKIRYDVGNTSIVNGEMVSKYLEKNIENIGEKVIRDYVMRLWDGGIDKQIEYHRKRIQELEKMREEEYD